jgi:hypothetical protein
MARGKPRSCPFISVAHVRLSMIKFISSNKKKLSCILKSSIAEPLTPTVTTQRKALVTSVLLLSK